MCFSKLVTMAPLAIIAVVVFLSTAVFAQKTALNSLREIEARNRAAQLELEQSRLKWQQVQSDFVNRNAELERSRAETDRVINWIETQKTEKRLRELAERAE